MTTSLPKFDFGRGSTELDSFVRFVLTPDTHDDRYQDARRFTPYAWSCAQQMLANTENSAGSLRYTGPTVIPDWLKEATRDSAYLDPTMGGPTLMVADPTNVDWFALAAAHPDDIKVGIDFEEAPTLNQVHSGLKIAQAAGVKHRIRVVISPAPAPGQPLEVCLDYLGLVDSDMNSPTAKRISQGFGGVTPDSGTFCEDKCSWEWASYWPTTE